MSTLIDIASLLGTLTTVLWLTLIALSYRPEIGRLTVNEASRRRCTGRAYGEAG